MILFLPLDLSSAVCSISVESFQSFSRWGSHNTWPGIPFSWYNVIPSFVGLWLPLPLFSSTYLLILPGLLLSMSPLSVAGCSWLLKLHPFPFSLAPHTGSSPPETSALPLPFPLPPEFKSLSKASVWQTCRCHFTALGTMWKIRMC